MKVLAIGAHPDDVEIFFYGTLAACRDRGDVIAIAVATDGAAGGEGPPDQLARRRADETKRGLASLASPHLLGSPDGALASHQGEAALALRKLITAHQPDMVLTHAPEDYHPDHRALSKLVEDAAGFICPVFFADTLMGVGFTPEFYVDISAYADEKNTAIMAHDSQTPDRFAAAAKIQNRFRAGQCNAPDGHYAEAFRMNRRFPFADASGLLPPAPPRRPFYRQLPDAMI